jgi:hypothetical protein
MEKEIAMKRDNVAIFMTYTSVPLALTTPFVGFMGIDIFPVGFIAFLVLAPFYWYVFLRKCKNCGGRKFFPLAKGDWVIPWDSPCVHCNTDDNLTTDEEPKGND